MSLKLYVDCCYLLKLILTKVRVRLYLSENLRVRKFVI